MREYAGTKYISISSISEISDIGDTVDDNSDDELPVGRECIEGEITAVLNVNQYSSCINCKAKVNNINEVIGECTKCGATLKMSKCPNTNTVRFVVEDTNHVSTTLTAFSDTIKAIIESEAGCSVAERMLSTGPMKFYVKNSIVKDVLK